MDHYRVVIQRIVSHDGNIIAETTSFDKSSANAQGDIRQTVYVSVSAGNSSRCHVKSSCSTSQSSN
ncbi:MAG: hypothetical protein ACSI46_23595 [Gloeotrichia echinulata DVL01]